MFCLALECAKIQQLCFTVTFNILYETAACMMSVSFTELELLKLCTILESVVHLLYLYCICEWACMWPRLHIVRQIGVPKSMFTNHIEGYFRFGFILFLQG